MKTSELIAHLQECIKKVGDREIMLMSADPEEGDAYFDIVGADVYVLAPAWTALYIDVDIGVARPFFFEEANKPRN